MNTYRIFTLSLILLYSFLYSCSSETSGVSCETDEQCPSGQYCGEDKVCHKGTKPIKDIGFDAGRDAGRDVGKDMGTDTTELPDIYPDSYEDIPYDTLGDIGVDTFEDVIEDIINPDIQSDGGLDAITDISEDIGIDGTVRVFIPSLYDMAAGTTQIEHSSDKHYIIKSITGTSARPIIKTKDTVIYNQKAK
ncbi:MAG: hypothetical protein N2746_03610 [Deltaproteobacteria bacterium]|nr:hypothetical protein [Deltaproteobacteria bacterium]